MQAKSQVQKGTRQSNAYLLNYSSVDIMIWPGDTGMNLPIKHKNPLHLSRLCTSHSKKYYKLKDRAQVKHRMSNCISIRVTLMTSFWRQVLTKWVLHWVATSNSCATMLAWLFLAGHRQSITGLLSHKCIDFPSKHPPPPKKKKYRLWK